MQEFTAIHEIEYEHKITGRPLEDTCAGWAPAKVSRIEKQTAIILETKTGKFAPLSACGDSGNYIYMARNFPTAVSALAEYNTYKKALKAVFTGYKAVKILNEKKKAF